MTHCSVLGCPNKVSCIEDLELHSFPENEEFAARWIEACGYFSREQDISTARVCSIHFDENSYFFDLEKDFDPSPAKLLKYDAIPTLFLPTTDAKIEQGDKTEAKSSDCKLKNIDQDRQNSVKYESTQLGRKIKILEKLIEKHKEGIEKKKQLLLEKNRTSKSLKQQYECLNRKITVMKKKDWLLSRVFSTSQIKLLSGKKNSTWTDDDFAVCYTIRHLSNRQCYLHLKNKLKYPLPGISSLKRWIATNSKKLKNNN